MENGLSTHTVKEDDEEEDIKFKDIMRSKYHKYSEIQMIIERKTLMKRLK